MESADSLMISRSIMPNNMSRIMQPVVLMNDPARK